MGRSMVTVQKMEPGVNGAIVVETRSGRRGYVFVAPDGAKGLFHPIGDTKGVRAFAEARADWRAFLQKQPAPAQ